MLNDRRLGDLNTILNSGFLLYDIGCILVTLVLCLTFVGRCSCTLTRVVREDALAPGGSIGIKDGGGYCN